MRTRSLSCGAGCSCVATAVRAVYVAYTADTRGQPWARGWAACQHAARLYSAASLILHRDYAVNCSVPQTAVSCSGFHAVRALRPVRSALTIGQWTGGAGGRPGCRDTGQRLRDSESQRAQTSERLRVSCISRTPTLLQVPVAILNYKLRFTHLTRQHEQTRPHNRKSQSNATRKHFSRTASSIDHQTFRPHPSPYWWPPFPLLLAETNL